MTRKQALAELIEKVEAGDRSASLRKTPLKGFGGYYEGCLNGSLDAAKALHEAVLPDFIAYPQAGGSSAGVRVWSCTVENWIEGQEYHGENQPDPARAWLLAILRARHAQES